MPFSAIGGIASGLGSLLGAGAASKAASQQAAAEEQAIALQQQIWNQTQANLAPYLAAGTTPVGAYNLSGTGQLTGLSPLETLQGLAGNWGNLLLQTQPGAFQAPGFQPLTTASFQASPGYQYQLQQALNATNNANVGATGALSGNTLKALQQNAQGLANTDWYNANALNQSNYATQLSGLNMNFNQQQQMLAQIQNLVNNSQNAAVNQGSIGVQSGANIASALAGLGNAQAAGTVGSANNIISGLSSLFGGGGTGSSASNALANLFGFGGSNQFTGSQQIASTPEIPDVSF